MEKPEQIGRTVSEVMESVRRREILHKKTKAKQARPNFNRMANYIVENNLRTVLDIESFLERQFDLWVDVLPRVFNVRGKGQMGDWWVNRMNPPKRTEEKSRKDLKERGKACYYSRSARIFQIEDF